MAESRRKMRTVLLELEVPAGFEVEAVSALDARAREWGAKLKPLPEDEQEAVEDLRARRENRERARGQEQIRATEAGPHNRAAALAKAKAVWG